VIRLAHRPLQWWLLTAMTTIALAAPATWGQSVSAPQLKAAFLLNFARFAEWPDLAPDAPLLLCVFGDKPVLNALTAAARGQRVERHSIQVSELDGGAPWTTCQMIFVGGPDLPGVEPALIAIRTSPVLTVSDHSRFAQSTGMVELFAEGGRMRFAVNVSSVQRARLRLSSKLLSLAKIVRDK
jgi:YfiR/HmsC-like